MKNIPIKAVSFDDTKYYDIPVEDMVHIEKIVSTYLYRDDECVRLCEITPSFELRWLNTDIWFKSEISDIKKNDLCEKYEIHHDEDIYMHVREIEARPTVECGEYETWEEAMENLQGNPPDVLLP